MIQGESFRLISFDFTSYTICSCKMFGRFHILSDFDEGKRSCRRKLERHNVRRRRKPIDSRVAAHSEHKGVMQTEHIPCDSEAEKGANLNQFN